MNFRRVKIETLWLVALMQSGGLEGAIEIFSVRAKDHHTAKRDLSEWLAQNGRPIGKDQIRNRGRLSQMLGQERFRKTWAEQGDQCVLPLARYLSSKGPR